MSLDVAVTLVPTTYKVLGDGDGQVKEEQKSCRRAALPLLAEAARDRETGSDQSWS